MKSRLFWKSLGVLSIFSLLTIAHISISQSFEQVHAAGTKTIYLTPNIWDDSGANENYHAWLFGSTSVSDKWATLQADGTTSRYKVNISDTYTKIIFTRAESSTPSWDTFWNQTEDLTLPTDGKNMFTVTSWNAGTDGKSTGTWSTYVAPTTTYTVNRYVDNNKIDSETVGAGQLPTSYNPGFGKTFDGWYDANNNRISQITSNTNVYGYTEEKNKISFALDISSVSSIFTGSLNLYAWDDNGTNQSWPGKAINDLTNIEISSDAKIIINNGTYQTVDITSVQDGKILKIKNTQDANDNYLTEWISPSPTPTPTPEEGKGQDKIFDSKYGTYYQLLVYSFADGAGNDGIGDFKGIKDHLDYLVNLGIGGLYLSPVQKADSYHGYDTTDYYQINPDYEKGGYTLKNLVDDCHAVGIKVILDMVLNHSSYNCSWRTEHPSWFASTHAFPGMIDFNYDNTSLRDEIKNVGRYWLNEYDVDGYRLDAVRWIYSSGSSEPTYAEHQKSVNWWHEFYEACQEEKEDVYIIGEDYIYDEEEIALYQESGLDSLFDFEMVNSIEGASSLARPNKYINYLLSHQNNIKNANNNAIAASFLSNHDRGRYGTNLNPNIYTLAQLMNVLAPGNSYLYYGDELNLQVQKTGGYDDFAYRTPMPFASEKTVMNSYLKDFGGGVTSVSSYPYSGSNKTAEDDMNNSASIYSALSKAITLKNNNPILYKGTVTKNGNNLDNTIGSYFISENDTTLTVIYNTSNTSKYMTFADEITLIGDVSYSGNAIVNGVNLTMAPYSVAILSGRQELAKSAKTGLYVRGSMNSWGVEDDYELTTAYQEDIEAKILNVTINKDDEFKICNEDWSSAFGFTDIYSDATFIKPSQLEVGSNNNNILCNETTTFNIYLLSSTYSKRLLFVDASTVTNPDGGYLLGDWNSWGMSGRISLNEIMPGETYRIDKLPLSKDTEFKMIIYETGFENWIGCDTVSYTEGYEVTKYGDYNNCKVTKSGIYDITITFNGVGWNYDVQINTSDVTQNAALTFAINFNQTLGAICDEDGNTNFTALNNAWSQLAEDFDDLSKEVKDLLKEDLSSSTATDFVNFNNMYNYIYGKYNTRLTSGNFISRIVSYSNNNYSLINNDENVIVVLVIVISVSLLTAFSFIYLRRRNKNFY